MSRARWINNIKVGDHIMVDEITGQAHFASEMVQDWDGNIRHKDDLDGKHPDYDKKMYPVEEFPKVTVPQTFDAAPVSAFNEFVGGTTVPRAKDGPADFLNNQ